MTATNGIIMADVARDYELGECIGKGNFASVFRGTDRATSRVVAIKRINKLRVLWGSLRKNKIDISSEVRVMKSLSHPHIVQLYAVYETPREISLVMEYARGGELLERVTKFGRYTEEQVLLIVFTLATDGPAHVGRLVISRVLSAISYMHANDVCHRDLKPENILLVSEGAITDIKITDFGLSKLSSSAMKTFVGTPRYIAPEMLSGGELQYGKEVDVWAVGVITYQLLSGTVPFHGTTSQEVHRSIITSPLKFPESEWHDISPAAHSFIRGLLCIDPMVRMTLEQAQSHPWLLPSPSSHNNSLSPQVSNEEEMPAPMSVKCRSAPIPAEASPQPRALFLRHSTATTKLNLPPSPEES